jgi:hypothetical protein
MLPDVHVQHVRTVLCVKGFDSRKNVGTWAGRSSMRARVLESKLWRPEPRPRMAYSNIDQCPANLLAAFGDVWASSVVSVCSLPVLFGVKRAC